MAKQEKQDQVVMTGTVAESSGGFFKIAIDGTNQIVLATLSGKIRMNKIRILVSDRVVLETSVYDLTRGRITKRL